MSQLVIQSRRAHDVELLASSDNFLTMKFSRRRPYLDPREMVFKHCSQTCLRIKRIFFPLDIVAFLRYSYLIYLCKCIIQLSLYQYLPSRLDPKKYLAYNSIISVKRNGE